MISDLTMSSCSALSPEELVRDVKHLPSAPRILPRLKQLLADSNSSMHEIVRLIRLDPGIAARVLQVGNSAYFSQGTRCFTVEEAVHRVGYDQVYQLVSHAVAAQVLVRPLDAYALDADDLWRMSVACALAAEVLAERTGEDRNIAYTVGLLHGVGMVVIDEWAFLKGKRLFLRSAGFPRDTVESERGALGFTHAEAGEALLKHWEFPTAMSDPVRWQYAPRASSGHVRMACLLYAAKWVRSAVCMPNFVPQLPHPLQLQPLGLSPMVLSGITDFVARRLADLSSLLDSNARLSGDRPSFPAREVA